MFGAAKPKAAVPSSWRNASIWSEITPRIADWSAPAGLGAAAWAPPVINLSVEEDWSPQTDQLPFNSMPIIGFIDGLPIVDRYDQAARQAEERRLRSIAEQLGLDPCAYALTEEFVAVTDEDEMPICYVQK